MVDWTKEELELEGALCNFCNAATDAWTPSEWAKETKRNFVRLCKAYNAWYSAKGARPLRDTASTREDKG